MVSRANSADSLTGDRKPLLQNRKQSILASLPNRPHSVAGVSAPSGPHGVSGVSAKPGLLPLSGESGSAGAGTASGYTDYESAHRHPAPADNVEHRHGKELIGGVLVYWIACPTTL